MKLYAWSLMVITLALAGCSSSATTSGAEGSPSAAPSPLAITEQHRYLPPIVRTAIVGDAAHGPVDVAKAIFSSTGLGCNFNNGGCPASGGMAVNIGLSAASPDAALCHCTPPWTAAMFGAAAAVSLPDGGTYSVVPVTLTVAGPKTIAVDILVTETSSGWVMVDTFCDGHPETTIVNGSDAAC